MGQLKQCQVQDCSTEKGSLMAVDQKIWLDRDQWYKEGSSFLDRLLVTTEGRILAGWYTIEGIEFDIDDSGVAHKRAVWGDSLVQGSDGTWRVEPYGPDAFRDAVEK